MESRVLELLARMSLREKIGQLRQISGASLEGESLIRQGRVGSFFNIVDVETCNRYQRIALEESPNGIPLLMGRDVIHGFRTVFPIPSGQAASWDPALVEEAASVAAREASACGVNWTFAPMVDIARDPRWGRIAEGNGEDPFLGSAMGAAMVRGFQGTNLADAERIAACAKHYVAYGAAEGGRDYNTTLVPETTLRDVYLPPFKACVDAGVASLMSAFNDLNGVPASGNVHTLKRILREEWGFRGLVVSDWTSISEMIAHGFCEDDRAAAVAGLSAGVDMEMVSTCYADHLESLVEEGTVPLAWIDEAVRRILHVKTRLGLFENPYVEPSRQTVLLASHHRETARRLARETLVLLKNERDVLPLGDGIRSIAVVGPLADSPADQLGCWVMDGKAEDAVTPLAAIRERAGDRIVVNYAAGLETSRSSNTSGFGDAVRVAQVSDITLLFVGEGANLSGEAHSRAFLDLPGAQEALVNVLASTGKPLGVIVMSGRPLTLARVVEQANALLMAWHPGTMGGPAIADVLFGDVSPSGKLPATFPRTVGQVPLYYNHKNTGRPPVPDAPSIPLGTPLDPVGFVSCYLDVDPTPLFPFGYGLSYGRFEYANLRLSAPTIRPSDSLTVSAQVTNVGRRVAEEVVQFYVRDLVGSVTRPVKELKGFTRIRLEPGASRTVSFVLGADDLAFHNQAGRRVVERGKFHVWIGGSSADGLQGGFDLET
jgi:beta-glucosidase